MINSSRHGSIHPSKVPRGAPFEHRGYGRLPNIRSGPMDRTSRNGPRDAILCDGVARGQPVVMTRAVVRARGEPYSGGSRDGEVPP